MCGIAGIIANSPIDKKAIERLRLSIKHRGPDGDGDSEVAFDGFYTSFIHTRLSIIDLDNGSQPLIDADTGTQLIANGELYNYIELRDELISLGYRFNTNSDSEVLLKGWIQWKEASLNKFNGMYAFAIVEPKNKTVHLVRDRLGIKPLYYMHTGNRLFFSSELSSLIPFSNKNISTEAVWSYLAKQGQGLEESIIPNIKRVPSATHIVIRDFSVTCRRYWDFSYNETVQSDTCQELLFGAIKYHCRADVELGLYLSGGIDSGLIAAGINHIGEDVDCVSIAFGEEKQDEIIFAQQLASKLSMRHRIVTIGDDDLVNRVAYTCATSDELFRDYAAIPLSFLAEDSKKHGLKIAFCGEGGDEVFAGYKRFFRSKMSRWALNILYPGSHGHRTKTQIGSRALAFLFDNHSEFRHEMFRRQNEKWDRYDDRYSDLQKSQLLETETFMADILLNKTDKVLMRFGIEGRVPFLDHRLVNYGINLKDKYKNGNKKILRDIFSNYAPQQHALMQKRGFLVPLSKQLDEICSNNFILDLTKKRGVQQCLPGADILSALDCLGNKERRRLLYSLIQITIWYDYNFERKQLPTLREPLKDWVMDCV